MDPRPATQDLTESQLADGCRTGDRDAQRELYVRTSERIYRLLLRMTHNSDDAFDLAQETYVRAFTRMDQFDGRSSVTTWLYRIAVNEGLQFMRRAGTGRAILERITQWSPDHNGDGQSTESIDVGDALTAISDEERAILVLRYQEGLDYAAIAEITGCPAGTIASRLNRARQHVRDLLKDGYGGMEGSPHAAHPTIERSPSVGEPNTRLVPESDRTGAQSP